MLSPDRRRLLAAGALLALAPAAARGAAQAAPKPPLTPKRPRRIEQLGRVRTDDYAWLRDPNWNEVKRDPTLMQPDIRAHLEAENRYAEAMLGPTKARQDEFVQAMSQRVGGGDPTPPTLDGPWAYYSYTPKGADRPVHARKPRGGGAEQVLLDLSERARGHAYFRVSDTFHSPDHSLFVWAEDVEGGDRYRVCVRDLATGRVHASSSAETFGFEGFVVSPDSQWVFWIWRDALGRPTKVYRTPVRGGPDELVHDEKDPALFLSLTKTSSGRYVRLRVFGPDLDEVRLIPAGAPTAPPILMEPRTPGLHYQVEDWDGRLVVLTDLDGALDGKLMTADIGAPGKSGWRDWIGYRPGRNILEMRAFQDHFVRLERSEGRQEIVVTPRDGAETAVSLDEAAYSVGFDAHQEYAGRSMRLIYQSPRTPKQWLDYDLVTGVRRVVAAQGAGAAFSRDAYEVRRLMAPAPDGETVPITLLMRRGTKLDGASPLLLFGYGAYGASMEADFSVPAIALVDQGFIYAIAHVRGGSEKGRQWFLDGRRFKKANSFTDFNACADHLIAQSYTRKRRIVAFGGSAGGLLVAGAANLRPDLWGGVIAAVPFVDMLNTMSDTDHPLVPVFRPDWGDPLVDPDAYDYIASISPYENVKRQPYPPVLATAGIRDDRVSYWEPAKWVAAVREKSISGEPALFLINMSAGHLAAQGQMDSFRQYAELWAFAEQSLAWSA